MNKKRTIDLLKIPTNIIEEHPIVKPILIICGAIIVIIATIEYLFGGVSFSYHFLKNFIQEPPPLSEPQIIIVNARAEYINFSQLTEKNEENQNFVSKFNVVDICGNLYLMRVLTPEYEILPSGADFLRFGQENLIYSVSIITDINNITLPLYIYADDTNVFEIQKKTASVKIMGDDDDVVGKTDVTIEINLRTLLKKHEALFNIVPKKDIPIHIGCIDIKCKESEIKYMLAIIPPDKDYLSISARDIGEFPMYFPERNFNKTTYYIFEVDTKQFKKISKDKPIEPYNVFSFEPKVPCNPEGKIYIEPFI